MTQTLDTAPPLTTLRYTARRFNYICYALAFCWICVSLKISFRLHPVEGPTWEKHDFSQFYMGGLIARHGAWDAMYPIPHPNSRNNPGEPDDSEMRPEYARLAAEAGIRAESLRYIQPPPFALMLEPVAMFPYRQAKKVWNLLMCICAGAVAVMAGKSYEITARRPSRVAGVLALVAAVSPLTLGTLRLMNVSPLIALFVGVAVFGLLREPGGRAGGALAAMSMVLGAIGKYVTIILLPMYVAMRRWRALIVMGVVGAAVLGISLLVMGMGPFRIFFHEMLPTYGRVHTHPWNRSLFRVLLRLSHPGDGPLPQLSGGWLLVGRIAQLVTLLGVLTVIFTRPAQTWRSPAHVMAGAAALLCWFLIFTPIFWDHYLLYLVPLWGWLWWEARRNAFVAAAVIAAFILYSLPDFIFDSAFSERVHLPGLVLPSVVLIAVIAMARLVSEVPGIEGAAVEGAAHEVAPARV
jgi:hypothetical protein